MNLTETNLKNLSGGELQNLAYELIPKLYSKWHSFSHFGACEGGSRTRKGTPDIWCKDENNNYIYIQATGDSSKGKMYEDTKKSVEKLVKQGVNTDATCISFLNYNPDSQEVLRCEEMCNNKSIRFLYYTNNQVAKLLDEKFVEIREYIFNYKNNNENKVLEVDSENFRRQVDYFFATNFDLDKEINYDLNVVLKEVVFNAFTHGFATNVSISMGKNYVLVKDNGFEFNSVAELVDTTKDNHNGGARSMKYLRKLYADKLTHSYKFESNNNINKFNFISDDTVTLSVNNDCTMILDKWIPRGVPINFTFPEHCKTVELQIANGFLMFSDFIHIFNNTIEKIPKDKTIIINSKNIRGMIKEFILEKEFLKDRIIFREESN